MKSGDERVLAGRSSLIDVARPIGAGRLIVVAALVPWIVASQLNARVRPDLPWAAIGSLLYLGALLAWLHGLGPPRSTSERRHQRLRLWPLAPARATDRGILLRGRRRTPHRIRSRALSSFAAILGLAACATLTPAARQSGGKPADLTVAIALDDTTDFADLETFGRAVGERRIVLLGENGHGVREFTQLKSRLVRYLHERKGFDVLVFEAPLFECADVYVRLGSEAIEQLMRECLLAPMHHAELRPLFEYVVARRNGARPLEIVGSDLQLRGWGPIRRPDALHQQLASTAPALAATIARGDSTLIARQRLGVDSLQPWILTNGPTLRAAYDSAAARLDDPLRQWLRNASALISRELLRSTDGSGVHPPSFYEIRDEWMARNILWAADSQSVPRKVVVWLHNDHARYRTFAGPSGPVRAAGSFLREWRPQQVFSAGFLHGPGQVTSNSRRVLTVSELPAGSIESTLLASPRAAAFLDLRSGPDWFRAWREAEHPILRAGMTVEALRPAVEFDALFWVRSVNPPSYRLVPAAR